MIYELIGILGIILISIAPLSQVIKTYKSKNVEGISITYFRIVFVALLCYFSYSVHIQDKVYIASNVLGLSMNGLMLGLIWRYK